MGERQRIINSNRARHAGDVPLERVRPLVMWLLELYGGFDELSQAMGVRANTLRKWKYGSVEKVSPKNAQLIASFVQRHKRPHTLLSGNHENELPPRFVKEAARV